jgi:putative colanic acid biosynthesis acetyltransferase WcaF
MMTPANPPNPHSADAVSDLSVEHAPGKANDAPGGLATDLAAYRPTNYSPGRSMLVRLSWYLTSLLLFENGWFPLGRVKVWILRAFGARIGRGLILKPRVRIKFPWRLVIGDHCWIGESVWIDNLAEVCLRDHVCVSQDVYLCTGSHDFRSPKFDLITRPIQIETGAWLAARATVLCGIRVGSNAVVAAGSIVTQDVPAGWIVSGNPARCLKLRHDGFAESNTPLPS